MEKYIRAIQMSSKRTGSTFLQNAINSHPDIMGIDEIFVNVCRKAKYRKSGFIPFVRPENSHKLPQEYLENYIYKKYPDKHIIFKLMANQINHHNGLLQYIKNNNIPIIFLKRDNLLKQVISGLTAAYTEHEPINISGQQLLNLVKETKRQNKYWKKELKDNIKLSLVYEDIIGKTIKDKTYVEEEINKKICDFFNVPYKKLYSMTKKKNKNDISVYIPNMEEIRNIFKNTEFEWMIK